MSAENKPIHSPPRLTPEKALKMLFRSTNGKYDNVTALRRVKIPRSCNSGIDESAKSHAIVRSLTDDEWMTQCRRGTLQLNTGSVAYYCGIGVLSPTMVEPLLCQYIIHNLGWLGSRVVSVLGSGAERPGFKSQPRRCRVTVLGKLFTPIVSPFTKQRNW